MEHERAIEEACLLWWEIFIVLLRGSTGMGKRAAAEQEHQTENLAESERRDGTL
jgi:hypothetical protein